MSGLNQLVQLASQWSPNQRSSLPISFLRLLMSFRSLDGFLQTKEKMESKKNFYEVKPVISLLTSQLTLSLNR